MQHVVWNSTGGHRMPLSQTQVVSMRLDAIIAMPHHRRMAASADIVPGKNASTLSFKGFSPPLENWKAHHDIGVELEPALTPTHLIPTLPTGSKAWQCKLYDPSAQAPFMVKPLY